MLKHRWSVIGLALIGTTAFLACATPVQGQNRGGGYYGGGGRSGGGYYGGAGRYAGGYYGYGGGGYAPGNYSYYGRGYAWPSYSSGDYGYGYPDPYAYYDQTSAYRSYYAPTTRAESYYAPTPRAEDGGVAYQEQPSSTATINVLVPVDAEVWFEGQKTQQSGTSRMFVSPSLESGRDYSYDVRARWIENGREVVRDRNVGFRQGDQITVRFTPKP